MEEAANNPPPPPPPPPPPSETLNKRKLSLSGDDHMDVYNSYFKIRAIVRQLRPHFMQVLQTPDFRNCKAAHEIREKLKLVSDIYKQMTVEGDASVDIVTQQQKLFGVEIGEQAPDKLKEGKEAELPKTEHNAENPTEMKCGIPCSSSGGKLNDDGFRGSYVVGGSAVGWNFIFYGGNKPVYYGQSKESHLSRKMMSYSPS